MSRWLQLSFSILDFIANLVFFYMSSEKNTVEVESKSLGHLVFFLSVEDAHFCQFWTVDHADVENQK